MISIWWLVLCVVIFGLVQWMQQLSHSLVRKEMCSALVELEKLQDHLDKIQETVRSQEIEEGRLKRLVDTHLGKNEQFEQQAKEAWRRYQAAGLMAGNAQAWLLRELELAVRTINRYRADKGEEPVQMNEHLVGVVGEFKKDHVHPDGVGA